jgi:hypothetical protein
MARQRIAYLQHLPGAVQTILNLEQTSHVALHDVGTARGDATSSYFAFNIAGAEASSAAVAVYKTGVTKHRLYAEAAVLQCYAGHVLTGMSFASRSQQLTLHLLSPAAAPQQQEPARTRVGRPAKRTGQAQAARGADTAREAAAEGAAGRDQAGLTQQQQQQQQQRDEVNQLFCCSLAGLLPGAAGFDAASTAVLNCACISANVSLQRHDCFHSSLHPACWTQHIKWPAQGNCSSSESSHPQDCPFLRRPAGA